MRSEQNERSRTRANSVLEGSSERRIGLATGGVLSHGADESTFGPERLAAGADSGQSASDETDA